MKTTIYKNDINISCSVYGTNLSFYAIYKVPLADSLYLSYQSQLCNAE